jgi:hypothetical protein
VSYVNNWHQSGIDSREGRSTGAEDSTTDTDSESVRVTEPGVAGLWRADMGMFPAKEGAHGACHRGARGGEGGTSEQLPHPIQDQLRRLGGGDACHAIGTRTVGRRQHRHDGLHGGLHDP